MNSASGHVRAISVALALQLAAATSRGCCRASSVDRNRPSTPYTQVSMPGNAARNASNTKATPSRLVAKQSASSAVMVTAILETSRASPTRSAIFVRAAERPSGSRQSGNGCSTTAGSDLRSSPRQATLMFAPPTSHPRIFPFTRRSGRPRRNGRFCAPETAPAACRRRQRSPSPRRSPRAPNAHRDMPSSAAGSLRSRPLPTS